MEVNTLLTFLVILSHCQGGILRRNQCNSLPLICPQWCLGTSGGCTECNCSKYGGNIGTGSMNGMASLGAMNSPHSGSGLSMINPGGMLNFASGQSSGNPQSYPVLGQLPSSLTSGFNPANLGPGNPFVGGGNGDPSNPSGSGNPGNLGQASGASNPSNPGSSYVGNPIGNTGNQGNPVGNQQGIIQPAGTNVGPGVGAGNGQVVATTTKASPSTKPTTTPPQSTTMKSKTTSGTCAPLRCTPPCDQGIVLAANGCPVCLCH